jgi:hypothetical protein
MIHIISKGYKYIQTQLDDFCGVITETVISLKSVEGIKKYNMTFGLTHFFRFSKLDNI